MPTKKWFFTNSMSLTIWTYGLGNTPVGTYRYEDKAEFLHQVEVFKGAGYDFIKDQA